jgi:hypothetical protein
VVKRNAKMIRKHKGTEGLLKRFTPRFQDVSSSPLSLKTLLFLLVKTAFQGTRQMISCHNMRKKHDRKAAQEQTIRSRGGY